uniref:Uncharacterized protein n=1 Tax=Vespula pensylvanica TaxID=30213 RepID=A0A834NQK4_VESPE|nr:hypothetical protein H0235_012320 [Vespula pensylvanica]
MIYSLRETVVGRQVARTEVALTLRTYRVKERKRDIVGCCSPLENHRASDWHIAKDDFDDEIKDTHLRRFHAVGSVIAAVSDYRASRNNFESRFAVRRVRPDNAMPIPVGAACITDLRIAKVASPYATSRAQIPYEINISRAKDVQTESPEF